MNQYLIAANSKRAQLILNVFRLIDLGIICSGAGVTLILFLIFQPEELATALIVLAPVLVCAFLVLPIPNYHNVLCVLINVYNFYFVDKNQLKWKGWCFKDEYKDE